MNPAHEHEWMVPGRHFGPLKSLGLLAGVTMFFAAAGPLPAQEAAVLAGTRLHVRFETTLNTARSKAGDPVQAEIIAPAESGGRVVLLEGDELSGHVTEVRRANAGSKPMPMLHVEFTRLTLPGGQSFPLKASFELRGAGVYESFANTAGSDGSAAAAAMPGNKSRPAGSARRGAGGDFTLESGQDAWLRVDADLSMATGNSPGRGALAASAGAPVNLTPPVVAASQEPGATEAPEFSLEADDGQTYSLESLQGKVVLLFFWASWCPVCRASIPSVVDLSKKFAGTSFTIIGISIDSNAGAWRRYYREHQMDWPQYLDRDHRMSQIFNVRGVPTFFLLDQNGAVLFHVSGWGDPLEHMLAQMIEERLTGANPQE